MRNLLKKGLNYRDQAPPNKQKAFSAVKEAVDNYIKKKSSLISKPTSMFMKWKNAILTMAKQKLDSFSSFHYNSFLSKPYVMEEHSHLQRKYVFVPTDKANNNESIICKKFYVQLIKNEVNSQTYNISSESVESINYR